MTGLVVGSMVPDLPLFRLSPWSYPLSHSVPGIVSVDLLAGVLLTVLWTLALRDPCADLAPGAIGLG